MNTVLLQFLSHSLCQAQFHVLLLLSGILRPTDQTRTIGRTEEIFNHASYRYWGGLCSKNHIHKNVCYWFHMVSLSNECLYTFIIFLCKATASWPCDMNSMLIFTPCTLTINFHLIYFHLLSKFKMLTFQSICFTYLLLSILYVHKVSIHFFVSPSNFIPCIHNVRHIEYFKLLILPTVLFFLICINLSFIWLYPICCHKNTVWIYGICCMSIRTFY